MVSAYLVIDDLRLAIKHYSMHISKYVDHQNNYPSGKGQFRGVEIEVEAPRDNILWEQAIASYSMTPLMVIEVLPATMGSQKTRYINLYDCHVVKHRANYNHKSSEPFTETIKLTCGGVEDSWYPATVYEEHWRVTYPAQAESTEEEEGMESRIVEFYTSDKQGNKVDKYNIGDIIYVIIESENKIGDTVTISLKDKTKDFKYKGDLLVDDTMRYEIKSNQEKIKLEVVKQN